MVDSDRPVSGEDDKPGGIQVIARAAAILRTLGAHAKGLSLSAIAQQASLPRSTVQRIVNALEAEGLVKSMGVGGGFQLGPMLGQLAYQTQIDIISLVRPLLYDLCHRLRESVCLFGMAQDTLIVLDHLVAERELRVVFPLGVMHVPLHATAPGKAMLATMTNEKVLALLPDPLPMQNSHTHDLPTLLAELAEIRSLGMAIDHDEYIEGLSGFAVSVDTYLGTFVIAVVVPASRIGNKQKIYRSALTDCKRDIERKIGKK